MSYFNQLGFLERALEAGAMGGEDALSHLMGLREQRAAQQMARRAAAQKAQTGALDDLWGHVETVIGEPSSLQDILALTSAQQTFQSNPTGALDQLFRPNGEPRIGGPTADMWETSPFLDAEDRRMIMADVAEMSANGRPVNDIRASIHSGFSTDPEYDYNQSLQETIDALIRKALGG